MKIERKYGGGRSQAISVRQRHHTCPNKGLFILLCLQLYKVTPQEEKMGGLLDSVVCKMATKDVM